MYQQRHAVQHENFILYSYRRIYFFQCVLELLEHFKQFETDALKKRLCAMVWVIYFITIKNIVQFLQTARSSVSK